MKAFEHDTERLITHINEDQSDMRGVKEGWYVMDKEGKLTSGPFSSREDYLKCLTRVIQTAI
jgi:hypothetical protein